MKISPVVAPSNQAPQAPEAPAPTTAQRVRSLRMRTNATPDYDPMRGAAPAPDPTPAPAAAPGLANGDTGEAGPSEETEPLSPQYAALARQRRALQVKERELADREKALEGHAPAQGAPDFMARLKSETLAVLREAGVSYDDLTAAIVAEGNGAGPELQALRAKVAELEQGFDQKLSDRDAQAEKAALAEMGREAQAIVAEGDDFEMVRAMNGVPKVLDLIKRTYHDTGEVLGVREALHLIEDEYTQQGLRMAAAKKVQSRLTPSNPPPQQHRQSAPTLTNRDTSQAPLSPKQRAMLAFHNQLKR